MTFAARLAARARTATAALVLAGAGIAAVATAGSAHADTAVDSERKQVMLKGATTASYYWDDASGRNGDTGLPASGKPM
ncbi:hypothetical protein ACFFRU_39330, partial [Planobispora longispora]